MLAREWMCGTFLNLGSPMTVEIAGLSGFDWLLIDHEHGPGGQDTLLHQLHAAATTPAFPIVRIAMNETWRFKRVLDMGAFGVMVPFVNNAAEARAAVAAMHYPPRGVRGVAKFNRGAGFGADFEDYFKHAPDRLLAIAQIESEEGVTNAEEIAAVEGCDVLFVGPADLSYNMGMRDQIDSPAFIEALRKVSAAAKKHGKAAGILVHTNAHVPMVRELGYTFVALGSDGGSVRGGLQAIAATLRGK